jgi:4-amino-4-deoxy-L-arabinose transferase-like glycosyltransferase
MEQNIANYVPKKIIDLFLIFVAYGIGLWMHSVLFTGDQKLYIVTAMEMREKGEWLFPLLMGEHSYYKPPWVYWSLLVSWKVFGFNSFATYLPGVLALMGTSYFLNRIHKLFRPQDSAGLIFAGMVGAMTYALSIQMEIWVVFFYTAAWWYGLRFLESKNVKFLYPALIVTGLSALVKSPLYSVFWVAGFVMYCFLNRRFDVFKNPHGYLASVFGVLLGSLWFIFILQHDGARFWAEYVTRESLSKLGGNNSSVLHMWADFSVLLFPFLILIVARLFHFFKKGPLQKFLWSWSLFPGLFFSFFPYRTETYLFILVPVFAFLVSEPGRKFWIEMNGALVFLFFGGVAWILFQSGMINGLILVGLIASSGWFFYVSLKKEMVLAYAALGVIFFIRLSGLSMGEKDLAGLRTIFANESNIAVYDPGRNIWNEVGVFSVALKKPLPRLTSREALDDFLARKGAVIVDEHLHSEFKGKDNHIDIWTRLKRSFAVPSIQDLVSMKNIESLEWKAKYQREFAVIKANLPK